MALYLVAASWLPGKYSITLQVVMAAGLATSAAMWLAHHADGQNERPDPWANLLWALCPALVALGLMTWATFQPALESLPWGSQEMMGLRHELPWGPISFEPASAWLYLSAMLGPYAMALVLYFVMDSDWTVRKLLEVLSINALVLTLVAFGQLLFNAQGFLALGAEGGQAGFSGAFRSSGTWAAFSLLWFQIAGALLIMRVRELGWNLFMARAGLWITVAWVLLGASVWLSGTALHQLLLGLLAACFAYQGLTVGRSRRKRKMQLAVAAGSALVVAAITLLWLPGLNGVVESTLNRTPVESLHLAEAGQLMQQRPWWGWGADALRHLSHFTQHIDLLTAPASATGSSALQLRMEHGWLGLLPWIIVPLVLFIRFLRLCFRAYLSWMLWAATGTGVLLICLTPAYQSPAFAFSLWVATWAAYRYSAIVAMRVEKRRQPLQSNLVVAPMPPPRQVPPSP